MARVDVAVLGALAGQTHLIHTVVEHGQVGLLALRQGLNFVRENPWLTLERDVIKFFDFWGLERELVSGAGSGFFGELPQPAILLLALAIFANFVGAMFLGIGQALVGVVKSADTVQAVARVLFAVFILLGTLGQSGALGSFWGSVARWSPVGVVMTLFAGVLNLSAWHSHDTLSLVACAGYIVVFATIGIRWFQWDAR